MDKTFAIGFDDVLHISINHDFTPIPEYPDYIIGTCINNGKIVTVIDSQKRLGLGEGNYDDRSAVIICSNNAAFDRQKEVGILVDRVLYVADVEDAEIASFGAFNAEAYTKYLKSTFTIDNKIYYVLDVSLMINQVD